MSNRTSKILRSERLGFPAFTTGRNGAIRVIVIVLAILGLLVIYLNQRFSYIELFAQGSTLSPNFIFAFNRTARFILNDLLAISLIWALFLNRKYMLLAFSVQAIGLLVVLPSYLFLKLSLEGDSEISSPLLSFLHRIIIHPVLILLLIPAFIFRQNPDA